MFTLVEEEIFLILPWMNLWRNVRVMHKTKCIRRKVFDHDAFSRKKWPVLSIPYLTSLQHVDHDPRSPQTHLERFLHKVTSDIRVRHLHKLPCLRGGSVVVQSKNTIWSIPVCLSVLLNDTVLYWFACEFLHVQKKVLRRFLVSTLWGTYHSWY